MLGRRVVMTVMMSVRDISIGNRRRRICAGALSSMPESQNIWLSYAAMVVMDGRRGRALQI